MIRACRTFLPSVTMVVATLIVAFGYTMIGLFVMCGVIVMYASQWMRFEQQIRDGRRRQRKFNESLRRLREERS